MSEIDSAASGRGSAHEPAIKAAGSSPAHVSRLRPKGGRVENHRVAEQFTIQFVCSAIRRWWMAALPCGLLLGAAAAAGVYLMFEPVYEATAWLQMSGQAHYLAFPTAEYSKRFVENQMEFLHSPLVLGPVVSRPEIAQVPEIKEQEVPADWLAGKIKISNNLGKSELVKVSFGAHSRSDAARVVNAVIDTYMDFWRRNDSEHMQRVIELLEDEKDRRLREVESMRASVRELAKQVTGKDPFTPRSPKDAQGPNPLTDLQTKLVNAEVERQILEARVKACEESMAKEPGQVSQVKLDQAVEENPKVQALRAAILEKKARLGEYDRTLVQGAKDPLYLRLDEEIRRDEGNLQEVRKGLRETLHQEFAAKLNGERQDELAKLRGTLNDYRVMERLLRERSKGLRQEAKEATGDTLQLEFKQAELMRAEQVLAIIAERAIQYRTEQRAPAQVVLLKKADEAIPPLELMPYKQMLLAFLTGFCFPVLLAVAWEWFARRVSDSDQIELHARLPVLAEIARLPARFGHSPGTVSRRLERDLGLFEESVDSLRTCLVLSDPFHNMQVLAITSAANSEGKTSIALQLAVSIAQATSQRVLLIDADMRSPDIHRLLQLRRGPGLAEVLSHQCSVREGIVTDWSDSVHVMPAGKLAASPHKLLGNGALKALLDEVRPLYHHIVIDTPPILPASEALVLARSADVCLICAMRDVSRIDRLRRSSDRLVAAGAHPAGVVLNGVPTRTYAHEYGAYYGYTRQKAADK